MSKRWTLENKVALITGASKGIGLACSKEFADLGAEVIMVARGEEALNEAAGSGGGKSAKLHVVAADVTTPEGRKEIFKVVEKIGRLDILVNNVGTNIRKKFMEVSEDDLSHLLETNLNSALAMCRDAHPWLLKGKDANVVFITSIAGLGTVGSGLMYGVTKAALNQATKALAQEWAAEKIRVNAIAPGYIETPLTEGILKDPAFRTAVENVAMLKRIGQPEEVSAAIAFLSMDVASFITGQVLVVDGGTTAQFFNAQEILSRS